MSTERLVTSYLLRVAIQDHRWRLTLHDLRSGKTLTFAGFAELLEHLDAAAKTAQTPGKP